MVAIFVFGVKAQVPVFGCGGDAYAYGAAGFLAFEQAVEAAVVVAVEGGAGGNCDGLVAGEPFAVGSVDTDAVEFAVLEPAKPVAVGNGGEGLDAEAGATGLEDFADGLAEGFGGVEVSKSGLASVNEIGGTASVEAAFGFGGESGGDGAGGGAPDGGEGFEQGGVVAGDVGNISGVFEPAFDFKGVNACIDEVGKAGGEVEVFEGEDVAVVDKEAPPGVTDCPFLTAGLGAFATVGGAAEEALGEVALPAEADA